LPSWHLYSAASTLTIERTRAHRGQGALLVHTQAVSQGGTADAELVDTAVVPAATYVRAFYYVPSGPIVSGQRLIASFQVGAPYLGTLLHLEPGGVLSILNEAPGSTIYKVGSSTPLPRDTWTCVELGLQAPASDGTGAVEVWIDATLVPELHLPKALVQPSPPRTLVTAGASYFAAAADVPASDVWLDDLIVDDKPIGCTR
jgi:hypothetical protein